MKKHLTTFIGLSIVCTSLLGQTNIEINTNTKHSVGEYSTFDRQKYINLHANLTEGDWTGEEEKMKYIIEDLDVHLGRDNGSMGWYMNQSSLDPNTGLVSQSYMNSQSYYVKNTVYGTQHADKHKYEDHFDLLIGGQEFPFWPGNTTMPYTGEAGWLIKNAEVSGDYMGRFLKQFFRNEDEAPTKGQPRPRFMEVINEPLYGLVDNGEHTPLEVWQYHNTIAKEIRKHVPDIMIGGFTEAFPYYDDDNFKNWNDRMKLFIDTCGSNMDFISIHIYDFNKHHFNNGQEFKGPVYYKGSRLEAVMDIIEQYSYLTVGKVLPIMISEYGGRDHSIEWKTWSAQRDWNFMKAFSPLQMQFMQRPDVILKTIPFIMNKAEWNYYSVPDPWRLMRKANEPDSYSGDWVFTELIKYYELWANVNGTRIKTKSDNPDILIDAYAEGEKMYVIASNLNASSEKINLNFAKSENNAVASASVKHLYLRGTSPILQDSNFDINSEFSLGAEATAIFTINFEKDIDLKQECKETKYYADCYLKSITKGQENEFNIKNVENSSASEAYVRVAFSRDHNYSKTPTVTFNGTKLTLPKDYSGDAQTLREQYFIMYEIPVPTNLLQKDNNVKVKFDDINGGHVSTVTLRVFQKEGDTSSPSAKADSEITLYPNPTDGKLNIKSNTEILNIDIYSLNGKLIYSNTNIGNSIDLSFLPKGLYLASIQDTNNTSIQKIHLK